MTPNSNSGGILGGRRPMRTFFRISVLVAMSVSAARADFNYSNFNSVAGLTLNGSAAQAGGVLRLTPNLEGQSGTTWRTAKVHVADGFDTTFTFRMATDGADGMAFVIQDSANNVIGNGGSGMGYQDIVRSLAVEIDTFGFFPETGNHISVQTRGVTPNNAEDLYSIAQYNVSQDLNDASTHSMTIRYRPGFLLVFLDGSTGPIINVPLDLTSIGGDNILDASGNAWVGFTAGTGGVFQTHAVHNWNFDETSAALPSGACCTYEGCVISDAFNCGTSIVGHFGGNGTDCETASCTGACCYSGGCFEPATVQNCADEPGTFMGVDTVCAIQSCTGACCSQLGTCTLETQADCTNIQQGVFHGAGTSCIPFPCFLPFLGACCVDGVCQLSSEFTCNANDDVWYGPGTSCTDINCNDTPGPFGSCCQPGNVIGVLCVDGATQAACEHFNGTYNGDGTECFTSNCSVSGECNCQTAMPITGTVFMDDSTTGAPSCSIVSCDSVIGASPAKIYAVTLANGGQCIINTCHGNVFDTIITVHSGCPMTTENLVTCDNNSCDPLSQVYFCATPGLTYYVRVGSVNGASGDYALFVYDYGSRILEGPIQNPANGHWYYMTAQGTWTLNEQLAITKGGHVVTINGAAENEWVRSTFTPIHDSGLFIGINDAATEGTFAWPNGDPVGYTNWEPGQPDGGESDDYGYMNIDGKWIDQGNCVLFNSGEGIIEVDSVTLPGLLSGPISNPGNCSTYYLTQPGTWIETQLKAQAMGGNLVTINNAAENEFVRANFVIDLPPAWIGLRDTVTEGTFFWADGTPLAYTNWMPNEPNNIGNEDYVAMGDGSTGGWNDSQGGGPLSGVIELPGSCLLGDMNCSGSVTVADIPNFIAALLGTPGFPGCNINLADINGDTLRNGRDIKPFVALLTP